MLKYLFQSWYSQVFYLSISFFHNSFTFKGVILTSNTAFFILSILSSSTFAPFLPHSIQERNHDMLVSIIIGSNYKYALLTCYFLKFVGLCYSRHLCYLFILKGPTWPMHRGNVSWEHFQDLVYASDWPVRVCGMWPWYHITITCPWFDSRSVLVFWFQFLFVFDKLLMCSEEFIKKKTFFHKSVDTRIACQCLSLSGVLFVEETIN